MAIPCCNATRSQPLERLAVFADLKGTWFRCFQMFVYAIVYAIVYANALNIFEKWTICCPICNILRVQTQIVPCFDYWVAGFLMASKSCWYYRLLQFIAVVLEGIGKWWKAMENCWCRRRFRHLFPWKRSVDAQLAMKASRAGSAPKLVEYETVMHSFWKK